MPVLKTEDYRGFRISVFEESMLRPPDGGGPQKSAYSVYIDDQDVSDMVVRPGLTPDGLAEEARRMVDEELAEMAEMAETGDTEGLEEGYQEK